MASPFFARIKSDLLQIVRSVPPGAVITYADLAGHLDISARQAAYILATLTPIEAETIPWHRVLASDGTLGASRKGKRGDAQRERLRREGHGFLGENLLDFEALCRRVAELPHGLPPQTRPPDAPPAKRVRGS
ncbi:methylated-DNA-protein-cysteine methyltransferase related protein [Devosia enhydra]|uniref:Methylated-DNA-protein-cysteine methyltransferase related protein n=1 Tax=Devosia enhydra TaxID=665118 RepID=A0A1K2HUV6_9HYPH|nr:MGMT family protein [Devosia enhydra]SFZ82303.1 methylated-DNA-protein-cysteine methyltransferase related protein [Devosia enhydra]